MSKKPPSSPQTPDEPLSQYDKNAAKRRAQDKKQDQAQVRDVLQNQIEDFSDEAFEEDGTGQILTGPSKAARGKTLKADRAAAKKRLFKRTMWLAGICALIWIWYFLYSPFREEITYGVCKVFLEQQVRYPEHLRYSKVDEIGGNSIRIWFRNVGPYGAHTMESMRCYFRYIKEGEEIKYGAVPFVIDRVTRNRREYYPERVDAFNRSMMSVLAYPPSLVFPDDLSDSLEGLRFNVRSFYKVRL